MASYQQSYSHNDNHFDVMAAFSGLDTARKMTLFDQIMAHRVNAYRNTMKSFWPQSSDDDARKLEIVLRQRISRLAHSS